jgi:Palmitoyl protein thioesterase
MEMSIAAHAAEPPSRCLLLAELRALNELVAFGAWLPWLSLAPRGDGHPVLVLPGLVASDVSTRPLRGFLNRHGYVAHGWDLGRNYGNFYRFRRHLLDRVQEFRDRHDRKVSLVGWSLGGIFAREIAKAAPDHVRTVITLGSPFNGNPKATNAWRLYEITSGLSVDDRDSHFGGSIAEPPPVPTTAIYSRTDGICAWQCCVEKQSATSESIEVEASHCGLGHHPAAVYAIADRLAQPEGNWRPFDRSGWKSFVYPTPAQLHRPGA